MASVAPRLNGRKSLLFVSLSYNLSSVCLWLRPTTYKSNSPRSPMLHLSSFIFHLPSSLSLPVPASVLLAARTYLSLYLLSPHHRHRKSAHTHTPTTRYTVHTTSSPIVSQSLTLSSTLFLLRLRAHATNGSESSIMFRSLCYFPLSVLSCRPAGVTVSLGFASRFAG